jgi:hypothetical protein
MTAHHDRTNRGKKKNKIGIDFDEIDKNLFDFDELEFDTPE